MLNNLAKTKVVNVRCGIKLLQTTQCRNRLAKTPLFICLHLLHGCHADKHAFERGFGIGHMMHNYHDEIDRNTTCAITFRGNSFTKKIGICQHYMHMFDVIFPKQRMLFNCKRNTKVYSVCIHSINHSLRDMASATPDQWSLCKTRATGTLASQAEIGVWVQAAGALLRGFGSITPPKT